tara:strand:- start:3308 stop:3448 length:141 start_codon:yes stop_codon:yes gene_type:complete
MRTRRISVSYKKITEAMKLPDFETNFIEGVFSKQLMELPTERRSTQ